MKEFGYFLAKFMKLKVLNFTKLGPCEGGSTDKILLMVMMMITMMTMMLMTMTITTMMIMMMMMMMMMMIIIVIIIKIVMKSSVIYESSTGNTLGRENLRDLKRYIAKTSRSLNVEIFVSSHMITHLTPQEFAPVQYLLAPV